MTSFIPNENLKIIDVQERLRMLQQWNENYHNEYQRLDNALQVLSESKQDIIKSNQLIHLQDVARYRQIIEPLYLNFQDILNYGFDEYRNEFAKQYTMLSKNEKKLWLNNLFFLFTPDLKALDEKIDFLINNKSLGQARNLLISGLSGSGKSTYLFWKASRKPVKVLDSYNEVPIVIIQCPVNNKSSRYFFQRILTGMGKTYIHNDNDEFLMQKTISLINRCKVKLLILDEITHIKDKNLRRRVLELSNATNICIIGAGVQPEEFTDGDLEISGRFDDVSPLPSYKKDDLIALLAMIDILLPFPTSSGLFSKSIQTPSGIIEGSYEFISKVTSGVLRDIMRLIHTASIDAIESNKKCLNIHLLRETWGKIQNKRLSSLHELYDDESFIL